MKRRFILQAIHPEYACSEFEAMFETEQLDELRTLLGPDAEDDPDIEKYYRLEAVDLAGLAERFGIHFDAGGREVLLHARRDLVDDCPYLTHTNYELPLMLDGRKKFARLYHEYPPNTHLYEDRFDRFVAQGFLHKEVDIEPFDRPIQVRTGRTFEGVRTAYYTLPGEEWRIQAWRMVEKAQAKTGWNDTLERLEGMLYGYEDWQNDWWAENIRRKRGQFGTILVHAALRPSELKALEHAGFRSLPALDRSLTVISSFDDDVSESERLSLGEALDQPTLIRFRVQARSYLDMRGNSQERVSVLRADQIKVVNDLLSEKIEIVT